MRANVERKRCPTCGRLEPKPYKPRPVCECGAKRWEEWYHTDGHLSALLALESPRLPLGR